MPMKTLEERLVHATELERQNAQWERAMSSLAALASRQSERLQVPAEALAELDAIVKNVHTAAGGVQV